MREYIVDLLLGLEIVIPPPKDCHHSITVSGDIKELTLSVNVAGKFYTFYLSDEDFNEPPAFIINSVKSHLTSTGTVV